MSQGRLVEVDEVRDGLGDVDDVVVVVLVVVVVDVDVDDDKEGDTTAVVEDPWGFVVDVAMDDDDVEMSDEVEDEVDEDKVE